jgi:ADP-ribosyltransferase exoenzyme
LRDAHKLTATVLKDPEDPSKGVAKFELNDKTKGEVLTEMKHILIQSNVMNAALDKLPSYSSSVLYRRLPVDGERMNNYIKKYAQGRELPLNKQVPVENENIIVQEKRFSSTSKTQNKAVENFGGRGDFIEFRISSTGSKDITAFSDKDEEEVLIPAGSKLKVLTLERRMVEKEDGSQVQALLVSCYHKH